MAGYVVGEMLKWVDDSQAIFMGDVVLKLDERHTAIIK